MPIYNVTFSFKDYATEEIEAKDEEEVKVIFRDTHDSDEKIIEIREVEDIEEDII